MFKQPGKDKHLVVEAKYLKQRATSKQARKVRRLRSDKVVEQAQRYGRDWKHMHPSSTVEFATFTNVDGLTTLGSLP